MPVESSATLLPLLAALTASAQQHAASPHLGPELLKTLLAGLPGLSGAALVMWRDDDVVYLAVAETGPDGDRPARALADIPAVRQAFRDGRASVFSLDDSGAGIYPLLSGGQSAASALLAIAEGKGLPDRLHRDLQAAASLMALALDQQPAAEERNLLRTLIDNLPDYVFVKDRESRMLINNRAHAVEALGAAAPEVVIGKTDFDFFPEALARQYYEAEQELMRCGVPITNEEYPSQSPDGQTTWHLNTKVPLRDADGNVIGLIGVVRDITALKMNEIEREKLLESEREQRLLAETLAEVSLALTAQTQSRSMMDEILSYARRLVPLGKAAAIALVQGDYLRLERWQIEDESLFNPALHEGQLIPLAQLPTTAGVATNLEAIVVEDVHAGPHPGVETLGMPWIQTYIAMPINLRDRVLGIIWMGGAAPGDLSHEDIIRLQPLANAAAIALENTRLLQAAQERATHEQRLNEIGVKLQTSTDVTTLMSTALRELGLTLGARSGRIRLTTTEDAPVLIPKDGAGEAEA